MSNRHETLNKINALSESVAEAHCYVASRQADDGWFYKRVADDLGKMSGLLSTLSLIAENEVAVENRKVAEGTIHRGVTVH